MKKKKKARTLGASATRKPAGERTGAALQRQSRVQRDIQRERERREAAFRLWHRTESRKRLRGIKPGMAQPPRPMRIAAEGDSWFDYPPQGFPGLGTGGVIRHLQKLLRIPILNYAHAGDEARHMLGVKQRTRLIGLLRDPEISPDVLLFSGGGNDIVGDSMVLWLRSRKPGLSWRDAVDRTRLGAILGVVMSAYEELVELILEYSDRCVLVLHSYSIPYPDGRGACLFFGPWLKPALQARGWTDPDEARRVVGDLLNTFRERQEKLAASNPSRIRMVQTQALLDRHDQWENELHPTSKGFRIVAEQFRAVILARFGSTAVNRQS